MNPTHRPYRVSTLFALMVSALPAAALAAPPASPEAAAKVLDLRSFPLMENAKPFGSPRTLSRLTYEVKATPAAAFEFQKKELVKRGFTELKGTYTSPETVVAHFTKEGFTIAVSSSKGYGPEKEGLASVTVINDGNVDLQQLPKPPGTKPFHPTPVEASHVTELTVPAAAAACRKLLMAAGWEPYGEAAPSPNQPDSANQWFKQNGIRLHLWVMMAAGAGNKTLIRYSAELMQADLPAPADAADPRYDDSQKTLRFAAPKAQGEAILKFYQDRLTQQGWKATTDKPVVDERLTFLIFRNAAKELLSLDLKYSSAEVVVKLTHQTEAEIAEEERLAKEAAEKERLAEAERNRKFKVVLPIPPKAFGLEKLKENVYEFSLSPGSGPAVLQQLRDHYVKDGWKEEEGTKLEKNAGSLTLKKDKLELDLSYFDAGFGDMEVRVSGSFNVTFETAGKLAEKAPPSTAKKPGVPGLPGVPELPPGVELPDDVRKQLEDALKGVKPPAKKPGKK